MPLSILQISDLHAEPKGVLAYGAADTASRTKEIRPWLRSMSEKVALIVVTGDIACDGNPEAYEIVRRTLEGLAAPVAVLPGNHDRRSTMRRLLGPFIAPHTWSEERLDFDMDLGGARVFGLDTLVPGSHTGALPAETLARLEREIDRDPRPAPPGYALHRLLDSGEWATHFGAMPIPDTFAGPYRFKGVVNPHED